jgi:hypothetical protein
MQKEPKHMDYQTLQQQALARALKNPAFRQAFVSNPKAALEREFNIQVPNDVTIRVLEDTPSIHTIVLPAQEASVQELSDAELEAVAGGQLPSTESFACAPDPTSKSCQGCLTAKCW